MLWGLLELLGWPLHIWSFGPLRIWNFGPDACDLVSTVNGPTGRTPVFGFNSTMNGPTGGEHAIHSKPSTGVQAIQLRVAVDSQKKKEKRLRVSVSTFNQRSCN